MKVYFSAITKLRPLAACLINVAANGMIQLSNNKYYFWGSNQAGSFGNNSVVSATSPIEVAFPNKTFCSILSSAYSFSIGLTKQGEIWTWGSNSNGYLGDNSVVNKSTPVSISGTKKTFCKISAGAEAGFGIDKYGKIWAWGRGNFGYLGDNTTINKSTPVSIAGANKTFCEISAGNNFAIAKDYSGVLWAWGYNGFGAVGNPVLTQSKLTPVTITGATKTFCFFAAGQGFAIALDNYGKIWGWGDSYFSGQTSRQYSPIIISGQLKTFCKIAAGTSNGLAIDKNGKLWGWGATSGGLLGPEYADGSYIASPVSIKGVNKTFCNIFLSGGLACAVDKNNRLWVWGSGITGGSYYPTYITIPSKIKGAKKTFCSLAAQGQGWTSFAIDKNNTTWGWGWNSQGSLGINQLGSRLTPVLISGSSKTFKYIIDGQWNCVGLDSNGGIWSWGAGSYGALGISPQPLSVLTPTKISGVTKTFCRIAGDGISMYLALDNTGLLWGWGRNSRGSIGNNSAVCKLTPVSVCGNRKTFCKISSGNSHSIAIDNYGQVWAWGYNAAGQLGNNSILDRSTPISIVGQRKTFCEIAGGSNFSLGIDYKGQIWAWGYNQNGSLGINSSVLFCQLTPVAISGASKTFCKISIGASGGQTVAALDQYGKIWTWGNNTVGLLGNGTFGAGTSQLTPVAVCGGNKTFCFVRMGGPVCHAIDKNGQIWAWGNYQLGSLGMNLDGTTKTPIRLCVPF